MKKKDEIEVIKDKLQDEKNTLLDFVEQAKLKEKEHQENSI